MQIKSKLMKKSTQKNRMVQHKFFIHIDLKEQKKIINELKEELVTLRNKIIIYFLTNIKNYLVLICLYLHGLNHGQNRF